ncbi:hypothetical protein [Streptomyces sp. NPDC057580]|uniref:hypothetical protein n=1 Tax=Streptomyces sp. NPDC057580 TaxID=3346173 RepID=UPI00369E4A2C
MTTLPSGARVDELTVDPVTARYVRMQGIKRATGWGYSLWRLEVRSVSPEPDPV